MLSASEYQTARTICDKAEEVLRAKWPAWAKGGAIPQEVTSDPAWQACTNELRGAVEQFEILRDMPNRIFAYLDSDMRQITVWTGKPIGKVTRVTGQWRINSFLSGHMFAFRATINGVAYYGRGMGGGMYCRLYRCKGK